jgi:hypothetical protein
MFVAGGFGVLFVAFLIAWLLLVASVVVGIAALISVARTPTDAFGPWWDNTKQTWLVGIAVSFLIPFGHLIAGITWFGSGRPVPASGRPYADRPFWAGPPRPAPPMPPPGWPGGPPPGWPGGPPPPPYAPPPPAPGP